MTILKDEFTGELNINNGLGTSASGNGSAEGMNSSSSGKGGEGYLARGSIIIGDFISQ